MTRVSRTNPAALQALRNTTIHNPKWMSSAVALAKDVEAKAGTLRSSGASPSAEDVKQIADGLSVLFDPILQLTALQSKLRQQNADLKLDGVNDKLANSDNERENQKVALETAQKAARKANSLFGKFPILKRIIGAVLAAVGTVAAVVTGGVAAALTITGAALLVASEVVTTLVEEGIIKGDAAQWVAMGLKIGASLLMAIGGGMATAGKGIAEGAAKSIMATAKTIKNVGNITNTVSTIALETTNAVGTGIKFKSDKHSVLAEQFATKAEYSGTEADEQIEKLATVQKRFSKIMRRLAEMQKLRGDTMMAATAKIA